MPKQSSSQHSPRVKRRGAWLALLLLALVALALVFTPAWLIQPFRPQTQASLALSYTLRRWSPIATIVLAVSAAVLCIWLWRGARHWWGKAALVPLLALVCLATWFARQNHFEWMFNPLAAPAYARGNEANFVTSSDMVLAVQVNGEAVAYPVRQMAYHHVVADTVGGTPLVATY